MQKLNKSMRRFGSICVGIGGIGSRLLDAGASVTAGSISLQPSGHGAMVVVTPHALVSTASNLTINSALAVSGADSLTLAASGTLWV